MTFREMPENCGRFWGLSEASPEPGVLFETVGIDQEAVSLLVGIDGHQDGALLAQIKPLRRIF
jgi:hypothetical protein